jgi:hypothetical protein
MNNDFTITGRGIVMNKYAGAVSMTKQTLRRYQPRLSILGCYALLHAIRGAKPQNSSRLRRN